MVLLDWRELGWEWGENSREEPQVLSESGQCALWYANRNLSYPFVPDFIGT